MNAYEIILDRLQNAGVYYRYHRSARIALTAIAILLCLVPIAIWSDMFIHLSPETRSFISITFLISAPIVLIAFIVLVFSFPFKTINLARDLEKMDPKLGSTLTNALQLKELSEDASINERTRDRAKDAVDWYKEHLALWNPKDSMQSLNRKKEWKILGVSALFLCLPILWGWSVLYQEFLRFSDPYGNHPPYSRTQLKIVSPESSPALVDYNKALTFNVEWSGDAPEEVNLRLTDPQGEMETRLIPMLDKGQQGYMQRVENIREAMWVEAVSGDGRSISPRMKVDVQMVPLLEKTWLSINPPEYSGRPSTKKEYRFKDFKILEGSAIQMSFKSNRPLTGGELRFTDTRGEERSFPMQASEDGIAHWKWIPDRAGSMNIILKDTEGFQSEVISAGSLSTLRDLAPEIHIVYPTTDTFVSRNFPLEVRFHASDDVDLKELRFHRSLNGLYSDPLIIPIEKDSASHSFTHTFHLKDLGVEGGEIIQLFADVTDNCPNPHMAKSEIRTLMVITEEEYNDYLRERSEIQHIENKYSKLMERYEEMLDQQEKLNKEMKEVAQKITSGEMSAEEGKEKFDEFTQRQSEISHQLSKLAKEMSEFVRDQPLYDIEKEFEQMLKEQAENLKNALAEQKKKNEETYAMQDNQGQQGGQNSQGQNQQGGQNSQGQQGGQNPQGQNQQGGQNSQGQQGNQNNSGQQGNQNSQGQQNKQNNKDQQGQQKDGQQQSKQGQQNGQGQKGNIDGQNQKGGQQGPAGPKPLQDSMMDLAKSGEEMVKKLRPEAEEKREQIEGSIKDLALMQRIIQDMNFVQSLYIQQKSITEQSKVYSDKEKLSRSDRLALQSLASEENQVSQKLLIAYNNLKQHAADAINVFPKAAQSANDLADTMEQLGLQFQAIRATHSMRMGRGPESWQMAENLRRDLASLFSKCEGGQGQASNELDRYLGLSMGMSAGKTFQQMMKSGLLGMKPGQGSSGMSGQGLGSPSSGYSMSRSPNFGVMGGEPPPAQGSESKPGQGGGNGKSHDDPNVVKMKLDKVDGPEVEQDRRMSTDSINRGPLFFQYREVVDEYFRAVTREQEEE